jgi:uncharacterized protein (UPF0276 family)
LVPRAQAGAVRHFFDRVVELPRLGLGVSTEYGAFRVPGNLDVVELRRTHPQFASFLELGVELDKGLDDDARAWVKAGLPTTYHFLDINLDQHGGDGPNDVDDFDAAWIARTKQLVDEAQPAWLCGDAGLWHFGPRDRGHMLLLPPVLTDESASALARGTVKLRELVGKEVMPENPPGTAFVGDLHLLDFFNRVAERADTGLLLDVAHLAMFQHVTGQSPLSGFDRFDCRRVVEIHVAGGVLRDVDGFSCIDDVHGIEVLDATWEIFEHVVARAPNLKAVVFECERNSNVDVIAGFERQQRTLQQVWR